jgi:hypothetical protein
VGGDDSARARRTVRGARRRAKSHPRLICQLSSGKLLLLPRPRRRAANFLASDAADWTVRIGSRGAGNSACELMESTRTRPNLSLCFFFWVYFCLLIKFLVLFSPKKKKVFGLVGCLVEPDDTGKREECVLPDRYNLARLQYTVQQTRVLTLYSNKAVSF